MAQIQPAASRRGCWKDDGAFGVSSPNISGAAGTDVAHANGREHLYLRDEQARESAPPLPIKRAVLNRLTDVVAGNLLRIAKIGNGACNFENSVVGAGAQMVFRHRIFQQLARRLVQLTKRFQLACARPCIACHLGFIGETRGFSFPRGDDALADLRP